MRRLTLVLSVLALAAAGCGGSESTSAGEGLDSSEMGGTRDTGSVAEQLSAEDVSEMEKLREQVAMQCDGGDAPKLDRYVDVALAVAKQNSEKSIVDLSQIDRATNLRTYLNDLAGLLDRCGASAQAEQLRAAEFRT